MTSLTRTLAFAFTLPVIALFGWMLRAVIAPVLIAALLAIMLTPFTRRLAHRLRRRGGTAPALVTLGTLVVILGPTALIVVLTFQELRGVKTSAFAGSIAQSIGAGIRFFQRSFGW